MNETHLRSLINDQAAIPERKQHNHKPTQGRSGYVYVVMNRDDPGWVKIGKSSHPRRRFASLEMWDRRCVYYMPLVVKVENRHIGEHMMHVWLSAVRFGYTEWFKATMRDVYRLLRRYKRIELKQIYDE